MVGIEFGNVQPGHSCFELWLTSSHPIADMADDAPASARTKPRETRAGFRLAKQANTARDSSGRDAALDLYWSAQAGKKSGVDAAMDQARMMPEAPPAQNGAL